MILECVSLQGSSKRVIVYGIHEMRIDTTTPPKQRFNSYSIPSLFSLEFTMQRGRLALHLDTSDVQCKAAVFQNQTFNDFRRVHVQTTINYFNETGSFVHDAAVTWAEKISSRGFSACVLKAGRLDREIPDNGLTFIDYIAYEGAPKGAVAGEESLVSWWDGTHCRSVKIPEVPLNGITEEYAGNKVLSCYFCWAESAT